MRGYDSAEALPAHEYRFRGIADRADAIARRTTSPGGGDHRHGLRHLRRAHDLADRPASLTWSRGWAQITGFMRRAALAETAAHIAFPPAAG